MGRKCRHRRVASWLHNANGSHVCVANSPGLGIKNVCFDCRETLPLGPARDDGEHAEAVALEVRAARIGTEPPWGVVPDATQDEIDGWRSFDHLTHEPRVGHLAGYLARCIAEHDDGGNE